MMSSCRFDTFGHQTTSISNRFETLDHNLKSSDDAPKYNVIQTFRGGVLLGGEVHIQWKLPPVQNSFPMGFVIFLKSWSKNQQMSLLFRLQSFGNMCLSVAVSLSVCTCNTSLTIGRFACAPWEKAKRGRKCLQTSNHHFEIRCHVEKSELCQKCELLQAI